MLTLSRQYAAATAGDPKAMLLAASQAMLSVYEGSGVDVGILLLMIAILLISRIMLRSKVFSRISAYAGFLAGALAVVYYILSAFTPLAIFILEIAGLFFVAWVVLVGRRLLQPGYSRLRYFFQFITGRRSREQAMSSAQSDVQIPR